MCIEKEIEKKLTDDFSPTHLKVINNSHLHVGHMGDNGTGNTHFYVEIATNHFKNQTKIDAHKSIYKSLDYYMKNIIHALEIKTIP